MWNEKVVVIAGGSKGLGLQIAKSFHQRGSRIVVIARDRNCIQNVTDCLNGIRPDSAAGFSVDLTNAGDLNRAVDEIVNQFKRMDVWVNSVGQSIRTSFAECKMCDYRSLMEQNFFASVAGSLSAIPYLQKTEGHLINIGSLASKTAWPFVSPYVTSKHALDGFAKQLRLEGPNGIHYLFVCPGPIQSNSQPDRYGAASKELPVAASEPGAGAPVSAIDSEWLAEKIIRCCEKRKPELVIPVKSRLLFSISQLWPGLGDKLIRRFSKR